MIGIETTESSSSFRKLDIMQYSLHVATVGPHAALNLEMERQPITV